MLIQSIISILGRGRKAGRKRQELMSLRGPGRITNKRVIIKKDYSFLNKTEYYIFDRKDAVYSEEE